GTCRARLPVRVLSERGRTEYLLVNLVPGTGLPAAYPLGKGSGSVTTWSRADGFVVLERQRERLDEGSEVDVTLLRLDVRPKDLVIAGSPCAGTDRLVAALGRQGWTAKSITVGSEGGLLAAKRGECDAAGMHLFDAASG